MIRQDYLMRLVAEMVQVLARVLSLKQRQEYELALREIDAALRQLGDRPPGSPGESFVEDWIALCRQHARAGSGLMAAVGELLHQQGDLLALQNKVEESHRSRALSLGLILESLLRGETFVSAELLAEVDQLLQETRGAALPSAVLGRLFQYFEARGRFAKAEDALFSWLEAGDSRALTEGLAFFERLLNCDDAELERGGLPRAEVVQGRRELLEASRTRLLAD